MRLKIHQGGVKVGSLCEVEVNINLMVIITRNQVK